MEVLDLEIEVYDKLRFTTAVQLLLFIEEHGYWLD